MRCSESINPDGNLLQSYRSLERAYAEGRIGAIGVCNVNAEELDEIALYASISPHAVQTFSLPGDLDMDVRIWCFDHHAAYLPFAYQRNAASLSDEGKEILGHIAYDHGANEHLVMTRFFLQTGAIVTPGSSHRDHIIHNIKVESFLLNEEEMNALGWPSSDPSNYHTSHGAEL
jgi:diketogulonate reductase-like aldo/keto reductase